LLCNLGSLDQIVNGKGCWVFRRSKGRETSSRRSWMAQRPAPPPSGVMTRWWNHLDAIPALLR